MKSRWAYPKAEEVKETPIFVAPEEKNEPEGFRMKCVACFEPYEMLFQGTSYCQKCLKERVRTGLA